MRRVKRVKPPVRDKAWHDAEMAKGFMGSDGVLHPDWLTNQLEAYVRVRDIDFTPNRLKPLQWYAGDPDTQPIKKPTRN